jgi:hypothetical protein
MEKSFAEAFGETLKVFTEDQLKEAVILTQSALAGIRPGFDMNRIKPGMSNEDRAAAQAEVQRVARELRGDRE